MHERERGERDRERRQVERGTRRFNPVVAMSAPPIAGPAIMPTVMLSDPTALAALSSSRGTSRGTIASSAGRCSPSSAAMTAAST